MYKVQVAKAILKDTQQDASLAYLSILIPFHAFNTNSSINFTHMYMKDKPVHRNMKIGQINVFNLRCHTKD